MQGENNSESSRQSFLHNSELTCIQQSPIFNERFQWIMESEDRLLLNVSQILTENSKQSLLHYCELNCFQYPRVFNDVFNKKS